MELIKKTNRNDCLKGGLEQLADLIEGLAKKEEWCFFVGDNPIHTMDIKNSGLKLIKPIARQVIQPVSVY